jgi:hypothetical protein
MSKRRKNQFKEALNAKREALATAAKQPKQEEEWEPETPELRAEVLSDRLAERDAELYATIASSHYDLKHLTPPPASEGASGTGQNVVDVINITRQSFGPNRGDVEGTLSYLASLVNQYQEPAAVTEEAGAA